MNDEPPAGSGMTTYSYDLGTRLTTVLKCGCLAPPREVAAAMDQPKMPAFAFAHDPEQRVFRLTAPDGSVEVFRDNPTRYLCLAPDEETGAMTPVMKNGKPVYLYLAREEREIR